METRTTRTNIQIAIDYETPLGTDSVYFTVDGDHVTVNYEDSDGTKGSFLLYNKHMQEVFDFLKEKRVVT